MNLQDIKMTVKHLGFNTNKNMANMNDYKITLAYNGNKITVNYHMGLAHAIGDINLLDLLETLLNDASSGSANWDFEEFCGNFGYDYDSRNAFKIYNECNKIAVKLEKLFTLDELKDINKMIDERNGD